MAAERIPIEQFLELAKYHPVLDVRSPGEYTHAHIPNAFSIPLFSDEERKVVGTIYKQESREKAIKTGLDFYGPKMRKMVEDVEAILARHQEKRKNPTPPTYTNYSNTILVYCWRGGMRSGAVSWLLDLYGFKVYTLIGGYKKFRNYVLDTFELPFQFKILGGYTGSGKTEVLNALKKKGEPVIDLENIASHKGSAFGSIGLPAQPGQEMFENLLSLELRKFAPVNTQSPVDQKADSALDPTGYSDIPIWLEDESQRIGLVNLPKALWQKMRCSPIFFMSIPFEERLNHLVEEYGKMDRQKMIEAIGRIQDRLGSLNAKNAVALLESDNALESFRILLKYYDKFYFKALHNRDELHALLYTFEFNTVTPENATRLVAEPNYHEKP